MSRQTKEDAAKVRKWLSDNPGKNFTDYIQHLCHQSNKNIAPDPPAPDKVTSQT